MPTWKIVCGDALEVMKTMPDCSVQCVVTSPPYWSLRDYQIEGQYGLEPTPEAHVAKMVEVFREVRRILRDDGTLWLNYGDSYAGSGGADGDYAEGGLKEGQPKYQGTAKRTGRNDAGEFTFRGKGSAGERTQIHVISGLKPKDLCGIPWRVALALQADGWWLRQDIIWHKPNPMPESVTDRCTKSHEYLFLLAKAQHYYFDADAIREENVSPDRAREKGNGESAVDTKMRGFDSHCGTYSTGRNRRSVWTIATEPCKEAHFATFPRKLVEPCIRAGTSEKGCCPKCGMPWERIVEKQANTMNFRVRDVKAGRIKGAMSRASQEEVAEYSQEIAGYSKTLGWQPSCECGLEPVPCTVFDPFSGISTTGIVALPLGRNYTGIELNPDYCAMARRRIQNETGLIAKETT